MTLQEAYELIDLLLDKADQPYFTDDEKIQNLYYETMEKINNTHGEIVDKIVQLHKESKTKSAFDEYEE